MTTVFIDGEAGTTGLQIRQRLLGRGDITLVSIDPERRKDAGQRRQLLNEADVSILCLPDEAAREAVGLIDSPRAVYGFAEMSAGQHDRIAEGRRIANPGCYPQGLIALLRPLVKAGAMDADYPVTYGAISGYSGGGRKMIEAYEAAGRMAVPYLPYGLTFKHKHLAEMQLNALLARPPLFQPAVGNFAQGMLATVPFFFDMLARRVTAADLHDLLSRAYAAPGFVEVAPLSESERSDALSPEVLNGTNRMRLHVFADAAQGQGVLMAIYDNLGKGASGAAVQNLNIMIGAAQDAGVNLPAAA
jgi:N-acetyl-gamma-glutamyl-phosphate reductase